MNARQRRVARRVVVRLVTRLPWCATVQRRGYGGQYFDQLRRAFWVWRNAQHGCLLTSILVDGKEVLLQPLASSPAMPGPALGMENGTPDPLGRGMPSARPATPNLWVGRSLQVTLRAPDTGPRVLEALVGVRKYSPKPADCGGLVTDVLVAQATDAVLQAALTTGMSEHMARALTSAAKPSSWMGIDGAQQLWTLRTLERGGQLVLDYDVPEPFFLYAVDFRTSSREDSPEDWVRDVGREGLEAAVRAPSRPPTFWGYRIARW